VRTLISSGRRYEPRSGSKAVFLGAEMKVETAESDVDIERVSDVLLQLRPAFDRPALIARIKEQMKLGYRVAYVEEAGRVLCAPASSWAPSWRGASTSTSTTW
jgi:hypothetical protein